MSHIHKISTDFSFSDNRGSLIQLVHEGYSQVNVIHSNQGVTRGGHYHKMNNEVFYIIYGEMQVIAKKHDCVEKYVFKSGEFFLVPPGTLHEFYYPVDTLCVSMYDKGVENDDGTKDIFAESE